MILTKQEYKNLKKLDSNTIDSLILDIVVKGHKDINESLALIATFNNIGIFLNTLIGKKAFIAYKDITNIELQSNIVYIKSNDIEAHNIEFELNKFDIQNTFDIIKSKINNAKIQNIEIDIKSLSKDFDSKNKKVILNKNISDDLSNNNTMDKSVIDKIKDWNENEKRKAKARQPYLEQKLKTQCNDLKRTWRDYLNLVKDFGLAKSIMVSFFTLFFLFFILNLLIPNNDKPNDTLAQVAIESTTEQNTEITTEISLTSNNTIKSLSETLSQSPTIQPHSQKEITETNTAETEQIQEIDTIYQNTNSSNNEQVNQVNAAESETTVEVASIESYQNTVYIGNTGKKYHYQSCPTLKGNGRAISLDETRSQGRTACKVCYK